MTLCDGTSKRRHDEVAYDGRNCPVCDALDDLERAASEHEKDEAAWVKKRDEMQDLIDGYEGRKW